MEPEFSEFRESNKSLKHECSLFKDSVSHMCLAGFVVASWSLKQEVSGSGPFTVMTNIFSLNSLKLGITFKENSKGLDG